MQHSPDAETRTPPLSLLFGWGAMLPLAALAVAAWVLGPRLSALAIAASVLWGGAILAFLGGVRRGLSFRNPGGPTPGQIGGMLWLFVLAIAALGLAGLAARVVPALAVLIVGYASIAVLDPAASARGEAPRFFARLRPVQMVLPVASLAAVLARVVV